MKTPILGGYAVARSVNAADNRLMNLYPEATPEGGKTAGFLTRCPGYKQLISSIGEGPIRGLWQFGGYMYVVSDVKLYKVDNEWTATYIGDVSGAGPVSMSDNGAQLFIACNPNAYTYSAVSNTFAQVTDPDFPGAVTVGFINGYFVFNEPNSQKLWITSYQDGTSVDPLDFAFTDANPDLLLSLMVNRNEIWLFGTTSTEVWYYSGNAQFPLDRIQGAFNEVGCAAPYSVAKLDNTLYWLGSDPRGNCIVYKAVGYGAQRVSTHGIEKVLQSYAYVGDAIGYSYQQEGHTFYVLTFPSADATWCFDAATNEWHERGSWVDGAYQRHRSNCQVNFNNKIILGDYEYGKLFEFSTDYYKDDIGIQRCLRSWRALPPDQNNLTRTAHHSLQLDMETGTTVVLDSTIAPIPPSSSITLTYNSKLSLNHSSPYATITDSGHSVNHNGSSPFDFITARSVKTWAEGYHYFELTYTVKDPGAKLVIGAGEATYDYNEAVGGFVQRDSVGYFADNAGSPNVVLNTSQVMDDLSAFGDASQGDVFMIAVECGNLNAWTRGTFNGGSSYLGGRVWFGRNGTWLNGDPSTLFGGCALFKDNAQPTTPYTAVVGAFVSLDKVSTTQKVTANFGDSAFAYSIPAGFKAWNKDNPDKFAKMNAEYYSNEAVGFVAVSSTTFSALSNLPYSNFVASTDSTTSGKIYMESGSFAGTGNVEDAYGECFFALGEPGMQLFYEPAGQLTLIPQWQEHEGCAIVYSQGVTVPRTSLTSLIYGQKYQSGGYVDSKNPLVGLNRTKSPDEKLMVSIDFDAGKVWFGTMGVWSGDPVAGTGEAWTFTPNNELVAYIGISSTGEGSVIDCFFNSQNYKYSAPTGYTVLNSSGLSLSADARIPKVLLRWSDDGGHTWSNYHERDMGSLGEYGTRVIWRRLGMTTKLRDRVYEMVISDPVKVSITGAELLLSGTSS